MSSWRAGELTQGEGGDLGHWTPLNLGELGFLLKDVLLQRLHQVLLCINQVRHVPCIEKRPVKNGWQMSSPLPYGTEHQHRHKSLGPWACQLSWHCGDLQLKGT